MWRRCPQDHQHRGEKFADALVVVRVQKQQFRVVFRSLVDLPVRHEGVSEALAGLHVGSGRANGPEGSGVLLEYFGAERTLGRRHGLKEFRSRWPIRARGRQSR